MVQRILRRNTRSVKKVLEVICTVQWWLRQRPFIFNAMIRLLVYQCVYKCDYDITEEWALNLFRRTVNATPLILCNSQSDAIVVVELRRGLTQYIYLLQSGSSNDSATSVGCSKALRNPGTRSAVSLNAALGNLATKVTLPDCLSNSSSIDLNGFSRACLVSRLLYEDPERQQRYGLNNDKCYQHIWCRTQSLLAQGVWQWTMQVVLLSIGMVTEWRSLAKNHFGF